MITRNLLYDIVDKFEIREIESHLIYHFIKIRKIDYARSPILKEYFTGFKINERLLQNISSLHLKSIGELEKYLELLIPKRDRKLNGAFFTPTYIVNFIIETTEPKIDSKCLDPSCGCGAFLLGFVDYYNSKYGKSIKSTLRENIFGVDILNYNINRSKLILTIFALLNDEILVHADFNLKSADSLRTDWKNIFPSNQDGKFDIIAGNPPYVKFQDLSVENRKFLHGNWKSIDNGTFNLYFAFFELGYNLLNRDGTLGYITPNNYFTSLAGKSLRGYFKETRSIKRIVDFSHRKVFDAQTYTAITFLNNNCNEVIYYDRISEEQSPQKFLSNVNGSPNQVANLKVKKWRLLKSKEQKNIKNIESIGLPLKSIVNIFVGIATLKDELYFLDSKHVNNGYFIKEVEGEKYKIERNIARQIYKISDFNSQQDVDDNTRHIIFPYTVNSGIARPITEKEMDEKFPFCFHYFKSIKEKLDARGKGKGNIKPFYAYGRSQGLTKTGKKLLTPTFSKKPRFLCGEDEEAMFCNGYGIYFKKQKMETMSLFGKETHPLSKLENISLLQKILNSYVMHYYVTKTSVSIQGGYPCYQKNFIENFTIPQFSEDDLQTLSALSDSDEIDQFLFSKYELTIQLPNLV